MAVQCFSDIFVVNQTLVSASTFVVKIAIFAKPETVASKSIRLHNNDQTNGNKNMTEAIVAIPNSHFFDKSFSVLEKEENPNQSIK